jgi:succinate-semialdehyde dehydrogenase/glutarate-semialdehyde dehydrogenase
MQELVADAKEKGPRVLAGGVRHELKGHYFSLAVLPDARQRARHARGTFRPPALLSPGQNIDEAIDKANSLPYRRRVTVHYLGGQGRPDGGPR